MPRGSPDRIPDHDGTVCRISDHTSVSNCMTKPAGVRIYPPVIVPASDLNRLQIVRASYQNRKHLLTYYGMG